jgi:hypothetical protein
MQTNLLRSSVWAALLALLPTGCSFAFVDGPPTTHKQLPYFECTSSNVLPTVDAVLGVIYGVAAVGTLADGATSSSSSYSDNKGDAILAGAAAAVLVASGIYGYQKTSSCREAKEKLMIRLGNGTGFGNGPGFAPQPPAPPVDPWLNPPPSSFGAFSPPLAAAPPAPTPPGPAQGNDNEVPKP